MFFVQLLNQLSPKPRSVNRKRRPFEGLFILSDICEVGKYYFYHLSEGMKHTK